VIEVVICSVYDKVGLLIALSVYYMRTEQMNPELLMSGIQKVFEKETELLAQRHPEVFHTMSQILNRMVEKGVSSHLGLDKYLRPAYVIMQGILEKTLTDAKINGVCELVKSYIITPRMPTPFLRSEGKELDEVEMYVATDFADYRKTILESFLEANNTIHAIYCNNARHVVQATDAKGLENYDALLARYEMALKDLPVLNLEMSKFPAQIAGAIYDVDGVRIAIESLQVSQIDNANHSMWSIKIGEHADARFAELNEFLKNHSDQGIDIL
jgi:hypothetical protein